MAALVGALALTACAGPARPPVSEETYRAAEAKPLITLPEAKAAILAAKVDIWKDPYSIREARIGTPYTCVGGGYAPTGNPLDLKASCVCIATNARNGFGGYTGIKRTIMLFPARGGITPIDGGILGFEQYCQGLAPFPELNGLPASPKAR